MAKLKLTKTSVEALPLTSKGQAVYFDTLLTGFGVYAGKSSKTYFAQRQIGTKTRRVTIGSHGVFTTEQARTEARNLLLRMAQGEDPNAEKRRQRLRVRPSGRCWTSTCRPAATSARSPTRPTGA